MSSLSGEAKEKERPGGSRRASIPIALHPPEKRVTVSRY
jgi:hypothetical protein